MIWYAQRNGNEGSNNDDSHGNACRRHCLLPARAVPACSENKHLFGRRNIPKKKCCGCFVCYISLFRWCSADKSVSIIQTQTSSMKTLVSIFLVVSSLQTAISQAVQNPARGAPHHNLSSGTLPPLPFPPFPEANFTSWKNGGGPFCCGNGSLQLCPGTSDILLNACTTISI